MKVLVLGGGNSPEREVSLRSAKSVAEAAREAGFEVIEADPKDGIEFLDDLPKSTIVLPILHGAGGEDGVIQAEIEKRNLPFLGSGQKASELCWNKWSTLQLLKKAGLSVPEGELVTAEKFKINHLSQKPYVLKIIHGGSSIGVLMARRPQKVTSEEVTEIFKMGSPAILEELVEGIEVTVAILDDEALPVVEIIPPAGMEFDYKNKYNGKTQENCPPRAVSVELQRKAQRISLEAHKRIGCRHFSRSDLIITPNGGIRIFDINTIPGLTDQSLFPKAALQAGISMPELVKRFAELVKRDYSL